MTSKIKVDNINKVSDDSNIINKCGTAINVGASGNTVTVTGNDIRSDSYKAADGGVIASQSGTTITLGASGDTIALASGASQTGFGREGSVNWQTGSLKTSTFTAASGEGYFINQGSAITANLPAGVAGAIVAFSDYARNFATYNLTVSPNGSEKIGGVAEDAKLNINGQAATFVYVDSTKGWINVQNAEDTETGVLEYISATGGTITCSGNCRIHTFTGPGSFVVAGVSATCANRNKVGYLVVAGGGGGGFSNGGGGGAGGYREGRCNSVTPYTASPLVAPSITVTAQSYTVTVGAGGPYGGPAAPKGCQGSPSSVLGITSTGGGGGGASPGDGTDGGSGGGGGNSHNGGSGNNPPVSPSQGHPGGNSSPGPAYGAGGGGGAAATGGAYPGPGNGGNGEPTHITGSSVTYAGGGGAANDPPSPAPSGGSGGGGAGVNGSPSGTGNAGTVNTGGGGGGGTTHGSGSGGGAGGSGIVIIRYKKS
jgi:hypothetical protein